MNSFRVIRLSRLPVGTAFIAALIFAFAGAWPAAAAPIVTATKDDNLAPRPAQARGREHHLHDYHR